MTWKKFMFNLVALLSIIGFMLGAAGVSVYVWLGLLVSIVLILIVARLLWKMNEVRHLQNLKSDLEKILEEKPSEE